MKRFVVTAILVPTVASAGVVMVDEVPNHTPIEGRADAPLSLGVLPMQIVGESSASSASAQIVAEPKVWSAQAGSTLREAIQKWADEAQWHLVWDAPDGPDKQVNYPIVLGLSFSGPVDRAVADCISLYEKARKPLSVLIQPDQKAFIVQLKNN